jgi:predicted methyltransferase
MKRTFVALVAVVIAAAVSLPAVAQDYGTIAAAPDRSDADRNTDKRRDPLKLLNFIGVKEGMKVLDMEAGAGYTTELLARAVGPTGVVYAQDFPHQFARPPRTRLPTLSPLVGSVSLHPHGRHSRA